MTALPSTLAPMKAVTCETLPLGATWSYEVKWDGMRALLFVEGGSLRVQSSNLIDVSAGWPELAGLPGALGVSTVLLDGELVASDERGRPSFGLLQQRMHITSAAEARRRAATVPARFLAFDLLHLGEHDLLAVPLRDRRRLLAELVDDGPAWGCSTSYDDGPALLDAATARGLEGVMAKRLDSTYAPGKRSRAWQKIKVRRRQEVVVGGWVEGEGNRRGRIGALLVGYHDPAGGPLRFAGRVGTGFNDRELLRLAERFASLASDECPFEPLPPPAELRRRRPAWLRPELVAEVEFGEWTGEGRLRHPSYLGLRADKDAGDVVRETR